MNFKRGDLICINSSVMGNGGKVGNVGTLIGEHPETDMYLGIDFGPGFNGHTLNGNITTETGWWIDRERFNVSLCSLENE